MTRCILTGIQDEPILLRKFYKHLKSREEESKFCRNYFFSVEYFLIGNSSMKRTLITISVYHVYRHCNVIRVTTRLTHLVMIDAARLIKCYIIYTIFITLKMLP